MEFITKRVVNNQEIVLLEEIIDKIDIIKFGLLLKARKIEVFFIEPANRRWHVKIQIV